MKLRHWFADQVVERSQELCDLYVRLDDCRSTETFSDTEESKRSAAEDTLLGELLKAHSRWELATRSFQDILVTELTQAPELTSDDDPPWDF